MAYIIISWVLVADARKNSDIQLEVSGWLFNDGF